MGLFTRSAPPVPPETTKTPARDQKARRDRLRTELAEATSHVEALDATIRQKKRELQTVVEEGNVTRRVELVADLGRLTGEAEAARTLAAVTETALATAEAALAAFVAEERLRLLTVAIEDTERLLTAAREEIGPAFVDFAEARGRAHELAERLARLRRERRGLGVARPVSEDAGLPSDGQLAGWALEEKHGDRVDRRTTPEPAFSMFVRGLAGPEPVTEPEFDV